MTKKEFQHWCQSMLGEDTETYAAPNVANENLMASLRQDAIEMQAHDPKLAGLYSQVLSLRDDIVAHIKSRLEK